MNEIVPLFQQASMNPYAVLSVSWKTEIAGVLVQWQRVSEGMQLHSPSPRQQHIHDIWVEISNLHQLAVEDIVLGIDSIDPDVLNRGAARMNYGTLLIGDVNTAVSLFLTNPNVPYEPTHALFPVLGCEEFPNYEAAQQYYAAYPQEQPTLDPNWDGRACEVFFGLP